MNSDIEKNKLNPAIRDWLECAVRPIAEQILDGKRPRFDVDGPEPLEEFRKEFRRQQKIYKQT